MELADSQMEPLYDLFAMMPTGEIIHVRKSVPREEADRVAGILLSVAEYLYKHTPRRIEDRWYVVSSNWRENGMALCWIRKSGDVQNDSDAHKQT